MDFQQQFPHPKRKNDPVIIEWTRGYGLTQLFYRNRLIGSVEGHKALMKGVVFPDDQLGKVELKLLKEPFAFELKIDGLHSVVNRNHPKFNIAQSAANFLLPLIFSILLTFSFLSTPNTDYQDLRRTDILLGIGFGVSSALYLASMILIIYRKVVGFFVGAGLFLIHYLAFIVTSIQANVTLKDIGWVFLFIFTILLIILLFSLRRVFTYLQYIKMKNSLDSLLDNQD